MTDTVNVQISPANGWVELSTSSTGSFTLTSGGQYCKYTGPPPAALIGHRMTGKIVNFTTLEGESLYVLASRECNVVIDSDVINIPKLLLEDGSFFLLENGFKLLL